MIILTRPSCCVRYLLSTCGAVHHQSFDTEAGSLAEQNFLLALHGSSETFIDLEPVSEFWSALQNIWQQKPGQK